MPVDDLINLKNQEREDRVFDRKDIGNLHESDAVNSRMKVNILDSNYSKDTCDTKGIFLKMHMTI